MDKKKRFLIQGIAALLQNANWKGFFTGKIYTGPVKTVCVPGLNCYSCPGAVGACPIGSLQNSLSGFRFKFPYYVVGILLFFGALLGRAICGFLCPFGFLQDLLHKIPFPGKRRTFKGDRVLRYVKYVVLIGLVVVLPILIKLTPVYCKYLCPSGTLSGIVLSLSNRELFQVVGALFTWKVGVLAAVIITCLMIPRAFCRYLCPLGAWYGLFQRISVVKITLDKEKCTGCKTCLSHCDMYVDPSCQPNSAECIRCGACIHACPTKALQYSIKKEQQ